MVRIGDTWLRAISLRFTRVHVPESEGEERLTESALFRRLYLCGAADSHRILDFQPESHDSCFLPRGCTVPTPQRGRNMRDCRYPLLGNDVAVDHVDASHLHHPVRRVDWCIEVVVPTAGL